MSSLTTTRRQRWPRAATSYRRVEGFVTQAQTCPRGTRHEILRLVRSYLEAGLMVDGAYHDRDMLGVARNVDRGDEDVNHSQATFGNFPTQRVDNP